MIFGFNCRRIFSREVRWIHVISTDYRERFFCTVYLVSKIRDLGCYQMIVYILCRYAYDAHQLGTDSVDDCNRYLQVFEFDRRIEQELGNIIHECFSSFSFTEESSILYCSILLCYIVIHVEIIYRRFP